jgi:hypothetical protein
MKKKRFTEFVSFLIEPKALNKLEKVTDDNDESMSGWVRELVYRELNISLIIAKPVIADSNADQKTNKNDHDQEKQHSTKDEDLILRELVVNDDEMKEQVDVAN